MDDFHDLTESATRLVKEKYPLAVLLEVDAASPNGEATDLAGMTNWRFVFMADDYATVYVNASAGKFGPVRYVSESWVDDRPLPWPVGMGPSEALETLRKAGQSKGVVGVALRWPLFPGVDEPNYIFETTDGGYVFVGTNTKNVQVRDIQNED